MVYIGDNFDYRESKYPIIVINNDFSIIQVYNFEKLINAVVILMKMIIRFKLSHNKNCVNITTFFFLNIFNIQ